MIAYLTFGLTCGYLGWFLCDWRHEVLETREWWAARPHIEGITCPAETRCKICYGSSL